MTRAAADALLQKYFKMLNARYSPRKCDASVGQVCNYNHITWMCQEAQTLDDMEKKSRWIGFIQGALWMDGLVAINDLKAHVIAALDESGA